MTDYIADDFKAIAEKLAELKQQEEQALYEVILATTSASVKVVDHRKRNWEGGT